MTIRGIFLLYIIFILFCGISFSQAPNITSANYFQLGGEYFRTNKIDTGLIAVSPGASGPSVEWDFSTVDFNHPSVIYDTLSSIVPEGTPFFNEPNTNYSLANFCLLLNTESFSFEDNNYFYYNLQKDGLQFIGNWANNGGNDLWFYSFSDFRTELIFPMTYNDSFTDRFESSFEDLSGSGRHYQTGSIEIVADAYGTMITPKKDTLDKVLRIKEKITWRDSSDFFGIENFVTTKFYWYSMELEGPILQFNMRLESDEIINAYFFENAENNTSTSRLNENVQFTIYPNPSNGSFSLNLNQTTRTDFSVSIFNLSGNLIKKIENLGTDHIELEKEALGSGLFLLELSDGQRILKTEKLIIR